MDSVKLGFQAGAVLYFSENLTPYNQRLVWKCRELKRAAKIHNSWSNKGTVKLKRTMNERPISIMHVYATLCIFMQLVIQQIFILILSSGKDRIKGTIDRSQKINNILSIAPLILYYFEEWLAFWYKEICH